MDSGNFLREAIASMKGVRYKNLSDLAEKAQVNQGNLSSFMKPEGDPKRRETMTFDSAWKIMGVLGLQPPTIRRLGSNAPVETIEGEGLPTVPVLGSTGAGPDMELFEATPEMLIKVPPAYALPSVVALKVEGDSMEPTIRKGALVGVVPLDDDLVEGSIYLVNRPPFGRVVKRVRVSASGELEFYSDNPSYEPYIIPNEGYEDIILAKVVWVWQCL